MSTRQIQGLHHVTAVCSAPQRNYDFYCGLLGLRLVKKTVNFDDPGTYHLYYADGAGTPGSVLTFFPWVDAPVGRGGSGQVTAIAYAVSEQGLAYWQDRLAANKVELRGPTTRFDETYLEFEDPDGLKIELVVADQPAEFPAWAKSPVPAAMQLRGFHSVTLSESGREMTHALLTTQMGWTLVKEQGGRFRYQAPGGGPGSLVDVLVASDARRGLPGTGTVHHVAFRVDGDEAQQIWRNQLLELGYHVSPVMDRSYFHSIYYREPGGVLFEIATNPPGFTVDESVETLGASLKLPKQYESIRAQIEKALPVLKSAAV